MIKLKYFYKIEVLPLLREQKIKEGKHTIATGFCSHGLFFDREKLRDMIVKQVCEGTESFNEDEVILTAFNRI